MILYSIYLFIEFDVSQKAKKQKPTYIFMITFSFYEEMIDILSLYLLNGKCH